MTTALAAHSDDVSAIVAQAANRIVGIRSERGRPTSGLIWAKDLIVTAEETLPEDGKISVTFADGTSATAELVGRDPSTDVALLKVVTEAAEPWPLAPIPQVGSMVVAVGRGEFSAIAALGLVSETGPAWTSMHGGQIDARIMLALRLSGRAEGGAVLAADGTLIGMAVSGPQRTILAIPGPTIERAVARLNEKGYVARGFLGLSLQPFDRHGPSAGIIVAGIDAEGPAAAAGFVIGDIITTWGGDPVGSVGDVARRLGTETIGSKVTLGVMRAGAVTDRTLTIGERPVAR